MVQRRFHFDAPGETIGIGIDLHEQASSDAFRRTFGLGDDPYLLYVGRIDVIKGSRELYDFFLAYKQRTPGPLRLVFVGEHVSEIPDHPDIVYTGFLDEHDKRQALAGALALVQPSRFESFSIVVCRHRVQGRPVLVSGDCDVLVGQVGRSQGGLPYRGFAEFEAAVELLDGDRERGDPNGQRESGRRYVDEHYRWDNVLDGLERTIDLAVRSLRSASPGQVQAMSRRSRPGPSTISIGRANSGCSATAGSMGFSSFMNQPSTLANPTCWAMNFNSSGWSGV